MSHWIQYVIWALAVGGAIRVLGELYRAAKAWFESICRSAIKAVILQMQRQMDRHDAELAGFKYRLEALERELRK